MFALLSLDEVCVFTHRAAYVTHIYCPQSKQGWHFHTEQQIAQSNTVDVAVVEYSVQYSSFSVLNRWDKHHTDQFFTHWYCKPRKELAIVVYNIQGGPHQNNDSCFFIVGLLKRTKPLCNIGILYVRNKHGQGDLVRALYTCLKTTPTLTVFNSWWTVLKGVRISVGKSEMS